MPYRGEGENTMIDKSMISFIAWNKAHEGDIICDRIITKNDFTEIPGTTTGGFGFFERKSIEGEKGERIGELRFTALNRADAINNEDLLLEMDDCRADEGAAFCPLYYPLALLDIENNPDDECRDTHFVYISRLYIEEPYRKQGIATFILSNLYQLLYDCYNIRSSIWLAIVKPDGAENDIKNHPLYKPMKDLLVKCGFRPTNTDRTFAFNTSLHKPFDGTVAVDHFIDYIELGGPRNYEHYRKTKKILYGKFYNNDLPY